MRPVRWKELVKIAEDEGWVTSDKKAVVTL